MLFLVPTELGFQFILECLPRKKLNLSHGNARFWCIFIRCGTEFKPITRTFFIGVNIERV